MKMKKVLILVILIIALTSIYYVFLEFKETPSQKREGIEKVEFNVRKTNEKYIEQQLEKERGVTTSDLYYPYKTLTILDSSSTKGFGKSIFDYISVFMYEDDFPNYRYGLISHTAKGINNLSKGIFMTVDIDNEVKYDLNKKIDENFLHNLSYIVNGLGPKKRFFTLGSMKIMDLLDEESESRYLSYVCDSGPFFTPPSQPGMIRDEFFRTRSLRLLKGWDRASMYNFKYTPPKPRNLTEGSLENLSKSLDLNIEDVEREFSDRSEKTCISDSYINRTKIKVDRFWEVSKNKTLEEIFWVYRLRDFYGDNYNQSKMKDLVLEYYNPEIGSFILKKSGQSVSPKANFYGIFLLNDYNDSFW